MSNGMLTACWVREGGKIQKEEKKKTHKQLNTFHVPPLRRKSPPFATCKVWCLHSGPGKEGSLFPRWGGGAAGSGSVQREGPHTPTRDEMGQGGGRGPEGAAGGRGNSDSGRLSWHSAGLDTAWASCCQAAKERGICAPGTGPWAPHPHCFSFLRLRASCAPLFYRGTMALLPLQTGAGASGNMQHPFPLPSPIMHISVDGGDSLVPGGATKLSPLPRRVPN